MASLGPEGRGSEEQWALCPEGVFREVCCTVIQPTDICLHVSLMGNTWETPEVQAGGQALRTAVNGDRPCPTHGAGTLEGEADGRWVVRQGHLLAVVTSAVSRSQNSAIQAASLGAACEPKSSESGGHRKSRNTMFQTEEEPPSWR